MDLSDGFFSNNNMHRLLHEAEQRFRKVATTDEGGGVGDIHFFLIISLAAMRNNYISFEEGCSFNIEMIGREFEDLLEKVDPLDSGQCELLAGYVYRFVQEYEVTRGANLSEELANGLALIRKMDLKYPAGAHVEYGQHSMLIGVLKKYLHHEEIVSIKRLPSTIKRAVEVSSQSEILLAAREQKVKHLEGALKKIKVSSDFVELASGFSSMRFKKSIEKHFNFVCLLVLAISLMSPAAYKVYAYYMEKKIPDIDLYTAVSIAALELVLVFFFRVALHNFRSVKAQMLQLDLRIALLQFIQSYVKFSGDARKEAASFKDGAAAKDFTLEKFEQVIFSGLVSGEDNLPSTFDGLDGLAKIIEKVKGK
ncbi:hypothetical protein [Pseudomonas qingdaonensis]|uniref:hypothetical protein n=1 Tax=Pseudomonas qingdaonensis TaxID=2056231 RepID=UPI001F446A69|nr:hypothetical protein [Pseudomonas qingdaonensis]